MTPEALHMQITNDRAHCYIKNKVCYCKHSKCIPHSLVFIQLNMKSKRIRAIVIPAGL